jgi:hypothetical protein
MIVLEPAVEMNKTMYVVSVVVTACQKVLVTVTVTHMIVMVTAEVMMNLMYVISVMDPVL